MCRLCRASLEGLSTDAFCPDCGLPVASSVSDRVERPVPKGLTCINCRYSLSGLVVEGVCPECAYPIARSLPGGLLKFLGRAELEVVRVCFGRVSAALIVLALFVGATEIACPQLGSSVALIYLWHVGAAVVLPVVAVCWWPLLPLRVQTVNRSVRLAAVMSVVGLGLAAFSAAAGLGLSVFAARPRWVVVAGIALYVLGRWGLAAFFVWGTRYSRAVSHDDEADAARHRWVAGLGVAGSLVPAVLALLQVPGAVKFLMGYGLTPSGILTLTYGLVASGGVLVALACLLWVGIFGRAERRTAQYISVLEAATLRKQLEGVE